MLTYKPIENESQMSEIKVEVLKCHDELQKKRQLSVIIKSKVITDKYASVENLVEVYSMKDNYKRGTW